MHPTGIYFRKPLPANMLATVLATVLAAALLAAAPLFLASCSRPGPPPRSGNSGAIGITVETSWADSTGGLGKPSDKPSDKPSVRPDKVYFIRLQENSELGKQAHLYPSNFRKGGQVYLLNAPPGRYVVVAVSVFHTKPGAPAELDQVSGLDDFRVDTTYFDQALVMQSEVVVKANAFAIAGHFAVRMEQEVNFGDKIQRHFHQVVQKTVTSPYGEPIIGASNSTASRAKLGENKSGREFEMRFLKAAEQHLAGTDWAQLVRSRMGGVAR